jgi:ParB family chromosome partitioning protein
MLEFALVENIQREDLNAIEIAISYQRLIDECKLTQEEMSDRVGKKRSTVANYLRLLKLPAEIQLGLREKAISMGHARALVAVEDPEVQIMVYTRVVTEELSVRSTEELVRLIADPAQEEKKEKKPLSLPNSHRDVEGLLATKLQSKIQINRDTAGKGKIVINFKSDDDFSRMAALFEKLND